MKLKASLISLLAAAAINSLVLDGCNSILQVSFEKQIVKKSENIFAPRSSNLEGIVGANELLINFPNQLPGAEKIDKYLTPGAKYCLVHIRQSHLTKNNSKKDFEEVKKVQNNIYSILLYLAKNFNVDKIYNEGLTPDFAHVKNLCAKLNCLHKNRDKIEEASVDEFIVQTNRLEKLKEENPFLYEDYLFFQSNIEHDAVYKAASEIEKIEIIAAEEPDALKEAEDTYNRLRGLGAFRWLTERKKSFNAIHENRENYLLDIASKQNSLLILVVYGANHSWGGKISCGEEYEKKRGNFCDNIAEWNSKKPDKKFSLIEISPFDL